MTKKELIEKVKERVGDFGKNDMASAVDIVFAAMKESLVRGERIELRGFGAFTVKERQPRQARNPKTGAAVAVPSRHFPVFKPGQEMKRMVDK